MKRKVHWLLGLSGGLLCGSLAQADEPAKPASKDAGVAAYINDQPVTKAELEVEILKNNVIDDGLAKDQFAVQQI